MKIIILYHNTTKYLKNTEKRATKLHCFIIILIHGLHAFGGPLAHIFLGFSSSDLRLNSTLIFASNHFEVTYMQTKSRECFYYERGGEGGGKRERRVGGRGEGKEEGGRKKETLGGRGGVRKGREGRKRGKRRRREGGKRREGGGREGGERER